MAAPGTPLPPSLLPSSAYPFTPVADSARPASDRECYALSLVENREFLRAAHVLEGIASPPPAASFLRAYSLYMDGERRRESARCEATPTVGMALAGGENVAVSGLCAEMEAAPRHDLDAFHLYLYGVVLRDVGRRDEAVATLLEAACAYPLFWSAWLALSSLITDRAQLQGLRLPRHWMATLFTAHVLTELHASSDALALYEGLSAAFPSSTYLQAQTGRCLYHARRLEEAQAVFRQVAVADPYRVEDMDTYSNMLYVRDDRVGLSALAHTAFRLDKYRPETCCAIGNYYSLRGEREKAVLYFRRALRLCPTYCSAWTLMGHEYVELKNTAAAIECYRRAVEANARDYRAWYGLGQTYELLHMYQYASYYYRRATALRPADARMWIALGNAYEHLTRSQDAVACYMRAAGTSEADPDGAALLRLARVHRDMGEADTAARFYAEYVEEREASQAAQSVEVSSALLFLAQHALSAGRTAAAEAYAERVASMPHPTDVFQARAIISHVHAVHGGSALPAAAASTIRGTPGDNMSIGDASSELTERTWKVRSVASASGSASTRGTPAATSGGSGGLMLLGSAMSDVSDADASMQQQEALFEAAHDTRTGPRIGGQRLSFGGMLSRMPTLPATAAAAAGSAAAGTPGAHSTAGSSGGDMDMDMSGGSDD